MPTRLTRQLFRERRRVALVVVFTFVAMQQAGPAVVAEEPLLAAGVALGLGAVFGGIAMLAPAHRGLAEEVAIAGLAFAGLARTLPGSALDLADPAGNALVALAVLLGLVVIARGMRRAVATLPLPCFGSCRFKARAGSRVDIHRLWYGLVPTPGQGARSSDPDLEAIADMSLRLGRVRLVTPTAPEPLRKTGLQILEAEAPFHIRLRACDGDGRGVTGATGISEIFLVDLGTRRLVLFAHDFPQMPLGRALLTWLDDTPGRMLDRRLARIERQALAENAGGPVPDVRPAGRPFASTWDRGSTRVSPATQARRLTDRGTQMSLDRNRRSRTLRASSRD